MILARRVRHSVSTTLVALFLACAVGNTFAADALGPSPRDLLGDDPLGTWTIERFDGDTRYRVEATDEGTVLHALAEDSASGLVLETSADLERHPVFAWSWSVDAPVPVADVTRRSGDDFAARVYLVFSGGWAFWRTTTLVYVWSGEYAPATPWPNPFTEQAMLLAATRGPSTGSWVEVRRNVREDYERAFGRPPPPLVAVAIMSDTDQTGSTARARYRDLRFETDVETGP